MTSLCCGVFSTSSKLLIGQHVTALRGHIAAVGCQWDYFKMPLLCTGIFFNQRKKKSVDKALVQPQSDLNGYFSYATMLAAATHSSFALGLASKRDTHVVAGEQPYVCRSQTGVNLTMRAAELCFCPQQAAHLYVYYAANPTLWLSSAMWKGTMSWICHSLTVFPQVKQNGGGKQTNCLHLFKEVSVLLVAFAQNKTMSVQIVARNAAEEALTMLETNKLAWSYWWNLKQALLLVVPSHFLSFSYLAHLLLKWTSPVSSQTAYWLWT